MIRFWMIALVALVGCESQGDDGFKSLDTGDDDDSAWPADDDDSSDDDTSDDDDSAGDDDTISSLPVLSAGYSHTCAVYPDGTIDCWGDAPLMSESPAGPHYDVGAGQAFSCVLHMDGYLNCWGEGAQDSPPGTNDVYTEMAVGAASVCALEPSGEPACWQRLGGEDMTPPAGLTFDTIDMEGASYHVCGLSDGHATCWGSAHHGQLDVDADDLAEIATGSTATCGIHSGGELECWGGSGHGVADPPGGQFDAVCVGETHACAIDTEGSAHCWGEDDYGQATPPPIGPFDSVTCGNDHTCGVLEDGEFVCWGRNDMGQSSPPMEE